MKRLRRKLTDEQIHRFEDAGNRFGNKLKISDKVIKLNSFIEGHRKVALPLIVVIAAAIMTINFIISTHVESTSKRNYKNAIKTPTTTKNTYLSQSIQELHDDNILIADSIQLLLDKENLTQEDTLYINRSLTYLNNLHKLIQDNGQENQPQAN